MESEVITVWVGLLQDLQKWGVGLRRACIPKKHSHWQERERERWGRMKGGECRCGCNDDGWGREGAGYGSNWRLNCGALISNQGASSIK